MPRPKGLPKTGGRKLGSLNKTTLLKEERRTLFEVRISQKWLEIIDQLKPEYIADQFMGKSSDIIKLENTYSPDSIVPELLEIAEEELKRRKMEE